MSRIAVGHVFSLRRVMTAPAICAPCRFLMLWYLTMTVVFAVARLPDVRDVFGFDGTEAVDVAVDPGQLEEPADEKPREWRSEERGPSVPREAKVTDDD